MKSPTKLLADEAPTFVYVMSAGDRTKIGIAGDAEKRRRQITAAAGVEMVLIAAREFSTRLSAGHVERALHKRFAKRRLPGTALCIKRTKPWEREMREGEV